MTLEVPKHPLKESTSSSAGTCQSKSLDTNEVGSALCPRAGLGTPANLPYQKGGELESPEDRAPPLHVPALHTPCLSRDMKKGQATP